jgi:hypothetical protein
MGKEEEARVRRGPRRSAAAMERRPARMTEALKCMVVDLCVGKEVGESSKE